MRRVLTAIIVVALLQSATAAPPPANGPWPEVAQRWIKKYRTKPEPMALPAVIRGLSQHGALKEPESSGLYVGFFAGVLGANPKKAWTHYRENPAAALRGPVDPDPRRGLFGPAGMEGPHAGPRRAAARPSGNGAALSRRAICRR